ncbi:MAG TPA: hypothetical protein VKY19_13420 [Ktedonosporobacter sp.]|jgi:hypothetical protein|nr:hypothetical protein [Ktedonosporobacter sp.]
MAQQGGGSSRTIGWILILIFFICNVIIGLSQYKTNIVLFFAELLSGLVGTLFSALQVFPDLFASLRGINLFQWTGSVRSTKWIYLIGLVILLISISLNVKLYLDSISPHTAHSHSANLGSTPSAVPSSPSQPKITPFPTNAPSSHTFDENMNINCVSNCNGDIILVVNFITTDTSSIYNQTWDLTITNGNSKPCTLEFTHLDLQDVKTNSYFDGRSPLTNTSAPWQPEPIAGRETINENPYFSNVPPTGTFILSATIAISCQDGVSFLSEQYQSDQITL